MESNLHTTLEEIRTALNKGYMKSDDAVYFFEECLALLVSLGMEDEKGARDILDESLPVMEELLTRISHADSFFFYYSSVVAFMHGRFTDYIEDTHEFYAVMQRRSGAAWLDWYTANFFFTSLLDYLPTRGERCQKLEVRLLKAHKDLSHEFFPQSAFDLYCGFRASQGQPRYRMRLLEEVLDKDPNWSQAWLTLGNYHADHHQWQEAYDAYTRALADEHIRSAALLFAGAYAAEQLRDMDTAISLYRDCLELDADYPYAHNNLGYCLNRKKQYEEAEQHLRLALESDANRRLAARNLFVTLERSGKTDELLQLVQQYPEHFQTKDYRTRISRILPPHSGSDTAKVQERLEKIGAGEYAGSMHISAEQSGIRLFEHQRQAVHALDNWQSTPGSTSGLFIAPIGGGKTLAVTYWLMHNVLDKGGRVLWLARSGEVLSQALAGLKRVSYKDLAAHHDAFNFRILSDQHDRVENIDASDDILIATQEALAAGIDEVKNWISGGDGPVYFVVEEAQRVLGAEYRDLIASLRKAGAQKLHMLGLTTLPPAAFGDDIGQRSNPFPDGAIYAVDYLTLIDAEIMAATFFYSIETEVDMQELFHAADADDLLEEIRSDDMFDFGSGAVDARRAGRILGSSEARNRRIVDTYLRDRETFGQTIIFAIDGQMAEDLAALFQEQGVRAEHVVSSTRDNACRHARTPDENAEAIERFRQGDLDVLINVNILREGVDLPQAQTVFLARPTKSPVLLLQMSSRVQRGPKAGGNRSAFVVDFIDNWNDRSLWLHPEKYFIDSNAVFTDENVENQRLLTRLISLAKFDDFAEGNTDERAANLYPFIERIPVGIYHFVHFAAGKVDAETHTVVVHASMEPAFAQLMDWLPRADLSDIHRAAFHVECASFSLPDLLLGYNRRDIEDILTYYRDTGRIPQWLPFTRRDELDVANVAQRLIDEHMDATQTLHYLQDEWHRPNSGWTTLFGYPNFSIFRRAVLAERRRLLGGIAPQREEPLTSEEIDQVQDLTLEQIREQYPKIGAKIRDVIYLAARDDAGIYHSSDGLTRSENRLDFVLSYIKPFEEGGRTTPDNLQLLAYETKK